MDLKAVLGDSYREDMTLADVEAALAEKDLVDRAEATAGMVQKSAMDKVMTEAKQYRQQLKERMTAEEQAAAEREAADKALQEELKSLRRDRDVNQHFARFVKLGYEEDLARSTAEAMVDQDFDTVFKNQQAFLAAHDKAMTKQAAMAGDKRPPAGNTTPGANYAKLATEAEPCSAERAMLLRLAQSQQ